LPIGDGLLYVEPVYIERANQQVTFPQLNRVLAAYGDRIGYAPTLREALNQIFGAGAGNAAAGQQGAAPGENTGQPSPAISQNLRQAVTDIANALKRLRTAQADGDFAAQGKALADLDAATKRFQAATTSSSATGPTSSNRTS
jgi:uncharacterized membrane protein (UPF0182 family)